MVISAIFGGFLLFLVYFLSMLFSAIVLLNLGTGIYFLDVNICFFDTFFK